MGMETNDSLDHSRRSTFYSLVLLITSIVVALVIAEISFRCLLFSSLSFMTPLQRASLYADDTTYELFQLEAVFKPTNNKPSDPMLGWVSNLITPISYRHADDRSIGSRRPVLFYGDSFVQCHISPQDCYQGIMNRDGIFSSSHYLINFGVSGYGIDQTYILYTQTVSRYDNPMVIIGILDMDLDRTILPCTFGVKPYFVLENGNLQCRTDHIDTQLLNTEFLEKHPLRVWSYLGRLCIYSRTIPARFTTWIRSVEQRKSEAKPLNKAILSQMIADLRKRNLCFLFILFEWPSVMHEPPEWRISWLIDLLKSMGVDYLLARDLFDGTGSPSFDHNRILAGGDGVHFNAEGNRLVSKHLLSWIQSQLGENSCLSIRATEK